MAMTVASADVVTALETAAREVVEAAGQEVAAKYSDLKVRLSVLHGQPARTLVERAQGADLLVVGSRGLGDFKALLLGSVSQECSQHSPIPVVIVRSKEEPE